MTATSCPAELSWEITQESAFSKALTWLRANPTFIAPAALPPCTRDEGAVAKTNTLPLDPTSCGRNWMSAAAVALTAFAGYALALWQSPIWKSTKWSTTLKATFDGLLYALLTAGTFGWLWPK